LHGVRVKVDMKTPMGYPCPSLNTQSPVQPFRGPQHTDAEKLAIILCIPPPHPDTAISWVAYEADITAWNCRNYGRLCTK